MAKKEENKFILNEAMKEVEELIKRMEDPECSLEESFEHYRKGLGLLKKCSESIDRVEKEIEVLEEQ
jgi:exodeoxyribonuclease VII small subunit